MGALIEITGHKFGRLTVLRRAENDKYGQAQWLCQCDCGNMVIIPGYRIRSGGSKSCGCLRAEVSQKKAKTHGLSRDINHKQTRLYRIYTGIKNRCMNKRSPDYPNYGGRGVSVCEEWISDFKSFHDWAMSNGYANNLSIDRIDPNGNYEPNNCRWVQNKVQARNKKDTLYLTYKGETRPLSEWAEIKNIPYPTLHYRFKSGWTANEILNIGVNHGNKIAR